MKKSIRTLVLGLICLGGSASANDDPTIAYRAGTISLPAVDEQSSGDPSIVSVNQGKVGYRVPIKTPPGKPGLEPRLGISYGGGRAETVVGAGWQLGVPSVRVKTSGRSGQPDYGTAVTYLGIGGEVLIDIDTLSDVDGDGTDETVYRAERDLSIRRYVELSGGGWRIDEANGYQMSLGTNAASRISRTGGTDSSYSAWVSEWLIEKRTDRSGNEVSYTWSTADAADNGIVDNSAVSDVARYLTEIRYGCTNCRVVSSYQSVTFNYAARSSAAVANILNFAPGFLVETELYLSSLLTATVVSGASTDIRTYTMNYDGIETRRMLLSSIAITGADGTSLPDLSFTYTNGDAPGSSTSTLASADRPGRDFAGGVFPMDFDKDGRVDIVDLSASSSGEWYSNASSSAVSFDNTATSITDVPPAGGRPTSSSTSVVDVNRDLGLDIEDLVSYTTESGDADGDGDAGERLYPFYRHDGESGWTTTETTFGGVFDSDLVHLDINRDGYADLVQTNASSGWTINLDDGTHDYDDASLQITCAASESPAVSASQSGVLFGDINGDDLVDVLYLISGSTARVWFGRGRGCFGMAADDNHGAAAYTDYTITSLSSSKTPSGSSTRLMDIDGDGLDDLVMNSSTTIRIWTFDPVAGFDASGEWAQTNSSSQGCRTADFDSDGNTEIICSYDWTLYDFADGPTHMLKTVDNGLGLVTTISYSTSGRIAATHESTGDAWSTNIAAPIRVVSSVEVDDSRGQILVTDYDYRDAYYQTDSVNDRYEFVGFGFVEVHVQPYLDDGSRFLDPLDPGSIVRTFYDVGDSDWFLRGVVTCTEIWAGDASPSSYDCGGSTGALKQIESTWSTETDTDGITIVMEDSRSEYVLEGNASGAEIRTDYTYDAFGNVIQELSWGQYDAAESTYGDDEAGQETTVINDTNEWLIGFASKIERGRITGSVGSYSIDPESIEYRLYDGSSSWSVSTLTDGLLTEVQRYTEDPIGGSVSTDTVEQRTYTVRGMLNFQTLADGTVINYDYDSNFGLFLTRVVHDPGGLALETRYIVDSGTGQPTQFRDPAGAFTYAEVDSLGRLTKLAKPGDSLASPTLTRSYSMAAPESTVTEVQKDGTSDGLTLNSTLDGHGHLLCSTHEAAGGKINIGKRNEYSANGGIIIELLPTRNTVCPAITVDSTSPSGRSSANDRYVYEVDGLARPLSRIHQPSGAEQSWAYDVLQIIHADEADNTGGAHAGTATTRVWDGRGRVISVTETIDTDGDGSAEDYESKYAWTVLDQVESVTNPEGNTVFEAVYDTRQRQVWTSDPDRGERTLTFDNANRVLTREDARGETETLTYDAAGRNSTLTTSDGMITYHYDTARLSGICDYVAGQLTGVEDLSGESNFCYNARGKIIRASYTYDAYGSAVEFSRDYDALDRIKRIGYPDNTTLVHLFDVAGSVRKLKFDGAGGYVYNLATNAWHNAAMQPTRVFYGNGGILKIGYDARRRPKQHTFEIGGSNVQDLKLTLDGVGNVTAITDSIGDATASFEYDDLYRLTEATGTRFGSETLSYEYDTLGNLTSKTSTDTTSDVHVGTIIYASDRIHAVESALGQTFGYDDMGNLTDDGTYTFIYNARGDLASVIDASSTTVVANEYDHLRRRVVKTNDDGSVVYFFPDFGSELRVDSMGTENLIKHIGLDGLLIARIVDTFTSATVADAVTFLAQDHLGSPTLAMDTSGAIIERWYNYPFGQENSVPLESAGYGSDYLEPGDSNSVLTRRFQGREIDKETGFYDFGARVYRADLGRFMTPDILVPSPDESQSFNRYSFVRNNPLRFTDPTGRTEDEVTAEPVGKTAVMVGPAGVSNESGDWEVDFDPTQIPTPEVSITFDGTVKAGKGIVEIETNQVSFDEPVGQGVAAGLGTYTIVAGTGAVVTNSASTVGFVSEVGGLLTGTVVNGTGVEAVVSVAGGSMTSSAAPIGLAVGTGYAVGTQIEQEVHADTGFRVIDGFVDQNGEYDSEIVSDTFFSNEGIQNTMFEIWNAGNYFVTGEDLPGYGTEF